MKEDSIEEDIKNAENFIKSIKTDKEYKEKNGWHGYYNKEIVELARILQHILSDYKRVLKENEEYSKQLDLDYVDKNYIPKQKIKAKIEELNKTINKGGIIYSLKQCAICQKDVLEKLLIEESED